MFLRGMLADPDGTTCAAASGARPSPRPREAERLGRDLGAELKRA